MTLMGDRYGRLTVLAPAPPSKNNLARWLVRCDCGTERTVAQSDLRSGHSQSCGCLRRERAVEARTTHGKSETGEYRVWCHMLGRCYNETDHKYPNYGGRGIRVCERWRGSFANFLADMGERPSSRHTIDRRDNDGDYSPDNCRWATATEQGQNKRNNVWVFLNGEKMVVAEASRRLGISLSTVQSLTKVRSCTHQEAVDFLAQKYAHRAQRILLERSPIEGNA